MKVMNLKFGFCACERLIKIFRKQQKKKPEIKQSNEKRDCEDDCVLHVD